MALNRLPRLPHSALKKVRLALISHPFPSSKPGEIEPRRHEGHEDGRRIAERRSFPSLLRTLRAFVVQSPSSSSTRPTAVPESCPPCRLGHAARVGDRHHPPDIE